MTRNYHHGDLKRALVAAGLDLLDSGGVDAISVRAAARAVGVSHAAPTRHFPDLRSFLAALAAACYAQLAAAMEAARDEQTSPIESLRGTGVAYIAFAVEQPNRFRALTHPLVGPKTGHPELAEAANRAFEVLRGAIATAQADGSLAGRDLASVALAAWSAVHGLAALIVDDQLVGKGYEEPPLQLAERVLMEVHLGFRP